MQIKTGGYYRRRDGQVVGPAENRNDPGTSYPWVVGGRFYTDDGAYDQFSPLHSYSLIAEVTVTDVLLFELKAGEKYETAKPDGSAGPVVELKLAKWTNKGMRQHLPFTFDCGYYCDVRGEAFNDFDPDSFLRITAPYIAPPPTIAERLEAWMKGYVERVCNHHEWSSELAAIVADLKAKESNTELPRKRLWD
jgi:hypothetical protein